ncbi:MAG: hypothetical protein MHPSP_000651 [Paramarteilia canceri]
MTRESYKPIKPEMFPKKIKPKNSNLKLEGEQNFETTVQKAFKTLNCNKREAFMPRKRTPYATEREYD